MDGGALQVRFVQQALNNAWANATLHAAVAGRDGAAFTARRPGFFPSLCATLAHICAVDRYHLDALISFRRKLGPCTPSETRVTQRAEGPVHERVDRLLLHLFQHRVHQCGHDHVQVQAVGIAPPQLDEFFLDHHRAPTAAAHWR